MEIKKFEAYRGPDLINLNRDKFIKELIDLFTDCEIFGYTSNGTSYTPEEEILIVYLNKEVSPGKYVSKALKLDLSNLGIEIGTQEFDDEKEDFNDFIPEINLDTPYAHKVKDFSEPLRKEYLPIKKNVDKFNI
jgi:hypothetical protein